MALPATNVSAPASATLRMFSALMPPSTSSRMSRPVASISLRAFCVLRSAESMKFCPPNPGLTLMMSTRSTLSITYSSTSRVGAGRDEGTGKLVDGLHHQVDIQGHGRTVGSHAVRLHCLRHLRTDGEIRHVVVIHHIEVDPIGAGRNDALHLFAQAGEVSRQNGGSDAVHARYLRTGRCAQREPRSVSGRSVA